MKLNIKRFDTTYTEYYPNYEYNYTPESYIRSCKVTITADYDITQVLLDTGNNIGDYTTDVTSDWTIEGNVVSRIFTEPQNYVRYVLMYENSSYGIYGYFTLNIPDDFIPDSDKFPVKINDDVRIANSSIKMKDVAKTVENYFDELYPIGSVYKTTSNSIPFDKGTWNLISSSPDRQCVGSQVIYDGTSGSGNVSKTSIYGAYSYRLINGVFDNISIPTGFHREYKLSFQGTTGGGNQIVLYVNNIATSEVQTYSSNTFRVIGSSNYFKESDITLETTKGYSQQGTNLHYLVKGTTSSWDFRNVTITGFIVSDTTYYYWKRTA